MNKLLVFASGSGTNAENIIKHFRASQLARVVCVFTNNEKARVIERANNLGVPTEVFQKESLFDGRVLQKVKEIKPDLIILAGFLLKFPEAIVAAFPNQIINIHPALLPKYGGKGMYGMYVHQAVVANKEKETGITIHYVNENYDEGGIVFQQRFPLLGTETPEEVAQKIHELEQQHFPEVIAQLLS